MEHYTEVGIADSVAVFRIHILPRRLPWKDILVCNTNTNGLELFDLASHNSCFNRTQSSSHRGCYQLLSTDYGRQNLLLTIIRRVDNTYGTTP